MQGRNRDEDVENRHVDTVGEGEGGTNWEIRIDIHTLPCAKHLAGMCCIAQGAQFGTLRRPRWVGGREVQEGGDICIHTADSLCRTVEINTTL